MQPPSIFVSPLLATLGSKSCSWFLLPSRDNLGFQQEREMVMKMIAMVMTMVMVPHGLIKVFTNLNFLCFAA